MNDIQFAYEFGIKLKEHCGSNIADDALTAPTIENLNNGFTYLIYTNKDIASHAATFIQQNNFDKETKTTSRANEFAPTKEVYFIKLDNSERKILENMLEPHKPLNTVKNANIKCNKVYNMFHCIFFQ